MAVTSGAIQTDSIAGQRVVWTLWRSRVVKNGFSRAETYVGVAQMQFHLFIDAQSPAQLDKVRAIARTFRQTTDADHVEKLPRPPPPAPPAPPAPRSNSSSPVGFRTAPMSIGKIRENDLAYFLNSLQITAESPRSIDPKAANHTLFYRIIESPETGDCVGGCPRTVVIVTA